jgi:hypothetical protein
LIVKKSKKKPKRNEVNTRKSKQKLQLTEDEKGGIYPIGGHDGATVLGAGSAGGINAALGDIGYDPFVISYEYKRKQEKQRRQEKQQVG